jgi:hypothetical protein
VLRGAVLVGYQQRNYDSAQYGTIAAPIVEGSVTWTPSELSTLTGRLTRSIQDEASTTIAAYTLTSADTRVDYEFRPNILLYADANVNFASYGQGGGNTTQLGTSLGASWLTNSILTVSGAVSYLDTRSSQTNNSTDMLAILHIGLRL